MTRRHAREMALQILFQKEFAKDVNTKELFELFQNHFSLSKEMVGYSNTLIEKVMHHQVEIDAIITKHSLNWNIKRLALVDLNILRLAICELMFMQHDPPPPKSVVNEAIEIAKKYSSQEAPSFINGILDQVLNKELKFDEE